MKKEARVHMLPTEKGAIATYKKTGNLAKPNLRIGIFESDIYQPQHLYVTTDEVAKKGDYYIHKELDSKLDSVKQLLEDGEFLAKKIIATTDSKLRERSIITETDKSIIHSVMPRIPQSFIEEYCKVGGIDKILVEYEVITNTYDNMVDLMCPHSVAEYEQTTSSTLKLKTDTNNCIIIHPVEEKMYSEDTFEAKCIAFADLCIYKGIPRESVRNEFDKWIKENL